MAKSLDATLISNLLSTIENNPEVLEKFHRNSIALPKNIDLLSQKLHEKNIPFSQRFKISLLYYGQGLYEPFIESVRKLLLQIGEEKDKETERLMFVTCFAAFFLDRAYSTIDLEQRKKYMDEVMENNKLAERIQIVFPEGCIVKSHLQFLRAEIVEAQKYSENALEYQVQEKFYDEVFIKVRRAAMEFFNKNYTNASNILLSCIHLNKTPFLSEFLKLAYAGVLIEKAIDELKFNDLQRPRLILIELLKENKNNIAAKQFLSVVEKKLDNHSEYIQHLTECYKLNPDNVVTIFYLAQYYMFQRNLTRAAKLANKGISKLDSFMCMPQLKFEEQQKFRFDRLEIESRFNYIIGLYYHQNKELNKASQYYELAIKSWDSNDLAHYGLTQIQYTNEKYADALYHVERIIDLRKEPEMVDCYKLFAKVLEKKAEKSCQRKHIEEAEKYYKLALKYDPKDCDTYFCYAHMIEEHDPQVSLSLYEEGLRVAGNKDILPEILNNVGVQILKCSTSFEKLKKADEYLSKAEDILNANMGSSQEANHKTALILTIKYNHGLVLEARGKFIQAKEKYLEVVNLNPLYTDAYIRIAELLHLNGEDERAIAMCEEAEGNLKKITRANGIVKDRIDKNKENITLEKGIISMFQGFPQKAKSIFESLKGPYAYLSSTMIKLAETYEKKKEKSLYQHLEDIAKNILNSKVPIERENIFAGQLYLVLASTQKMDCSQQILEMLRSCVNEKIYNIYNYAVYYYAKEKYNTALELFKMVADKNFFVSFNEIEDLLYCMAATYVKINKIDLSIKNLKKLIYMNPEKNIHFVNLLQAMYKNYSNQYSEKTKFRTVEDFDKAIIVLKKGCKTIKKTKHSIDNNDPLHKKGREIADKFESILSTARGDLEKLREKKKEERKEEKKIEPITRIVPGQKEVGKGKPGPTKEDLENLKRQEEEFKKALEIQRLLDDEKTTIKNKEKKRNEDDNEKKIIKKKKIQKNDGNTQTKESKKNKKKKLKQKSDDEDIELFQEDQDDDEGGLSFSRNVTEYSGFDGRKDKPEKGGSPAYNNTKELEEETFKDKQNAGGGKRLKKLKGNDDTESVLPHQDKASKRILRGIEEEEQIKSRAAKTDGKKNFFSKIIETGRIRFYNQKTRIKFLFLKIQFFKKNLIKKNKNQLKMQNFVLKFDPFFNFLGSI